MTRRKMAFSQDLLWILGTHKLGLVDRSINCGPASAMGKVHDLRVPPQRMKCRRGHFTKQSERWVMLSKGWSRSKL